MLASAPTRDDAGTHRWVRLLQAALLGLLCWNLFVYGGQDHEQITTRHYFSSATNSLEFYYGGYGHEYFDYGDRLVPIQREGTFNFSNFAALQNNNPPPGRGDFVRGYDGAGRMFSSGFLPALVQRLSLGKLNVHQTYLVVNALLWLLGTGVAYAFARRAFQDPFARLIAPALVASYPVVTLMFQSFKIQYAHSILILAGLYLAHFVFRRLDLFSMTVGFTSLSLMGAFSGGGDVLLLLALFAWLFACHAFVADTPMMAGVDRKSSLRLIATAVAGIVLSAAIIALLRQYQDLPADSPFYNFRKTFVTDTVEYARAWLTGADRSGLRFLGYQGDSFFTSTLLMFAKSIWWSNPIVLCGGLAAFFLRRETRPFVFTAIVLFLPAHTPEMLVSWIGTYGYGNAPSTLLLMVAFAGALGGLLALKPGGSPRGRPIAQLAAIALLAGSIAFYLTGRKNHIDNYYFSWGVLNATENIHAYHDGRHTEY